MKRLKIIFLSLLISLHINAFDEFLVSDIRIVGLQRVSTGSIFNVIPISVGDRIDQRKSNDIVRSLFATEQFDNIQIGKEGNTLIITVEERPSISAIELSGNKALKTEQLLESLDGVGIKEGEVYKRSTLEKVKSELVRSYSANGRYGATVEIEEINKFIKGIGLKGIQSQTQGDQVRVSGKKRDDLQAVINAVKDNDFVAVGQ